MKSLLHRIVTLALCAALIGGVGFALPTAQEDGIASAALTAKAAKPSSLPVKTTAKTGVSVYSNAKAVVDASNQAEGYLLLRYTGGKNVRIKAQLTRAGGTTYTYDLNQNGVFETFPLSDGDGVYTVRVLENVSGTKYSVAYSCEVPVTLRNDFLPFLYPNQYVNYTASSKVVYKAAELAKGRGSDMEKLTAIYHFVVNNFTYDHAKAKTVVSGYLPDVDAVLAAKKGICFDYASVMAAMLRSQNIPCKLVVGYTGSTYHAWINVYLEGVGWVDQVIYFDGKSWSLMDPTFVSSGKSSPSILKYVTNASNYSAKYVY